METNTNQKVSCIVNYSYDASEPDELTIRPGDVLRDVERLPGGWWRGELRGRKGMFPDNFVSVLTDQNNASLNRPSNVQGRCRAVYSYQPANPDELPLCVGDVLEVLNEVEEGWWKGRRSGRVGVFPSNFVVMLETSPTPAPPLHPAPPLEPAPALPPKPVKELCRVLFPYTAVNEDELTLSEGDIVSIVSKEAPDRGWWKGELHGRVGFFPDNFVQLLPAVAQEVEEKKPDRPSSKTNSLYPVLNKYSEKTASVKELTTSKISMHKENTVSKESSTQSTVTHTTKNETEKIVHNETVIDGSTDTQVKKPPVPLKKSPTPGTVGGLFSGLKNKMLSSSDKTEKTVSSSVTAFDRTDGITSSKAIVNDTNSFDHVERNSILNDPRAGRVKAPRRRPPSQALRDDTLQQIGLSNGHEAPIEKSPEKEEIRPKARDWEKHRAPWMEELKLNQARKTSGDGKTRPSEAGLKSGGSTDRILECGLEDKRSSHSMEMSKSTSSISNRISVLENIKSTTETKTQVSESKKESLPPELPTTSPPSLQSPTAAGRTISAMFEEVRKPPAPAPPIAARLSDHEKSKQDKTDRHSDRFSSLDGSDKSDVTEVTDPSKYLSLEKSTDKNNEINKLAATADRFSDIQIFATEKTSVKNEASKFSIIEKSTAAIEKNEKTEILRSSTLERRPKNDKECSEALIAQLNNRILNLEKLIEVQNAKFNTAIEDLSNKLKQETEKRQALQMEIEKLAHCVTQV
ncbi:SH3 domain-containing kinase-binding protein 1 isoform X1 [Danaus plexippus]|uniref:SH3 domain-containing kinase-binding protein 1 isoform X1 n=1 Tax=Danaus plexippus TaxID=13037 RepID=UPI002AAF67E4|nr:SH3 domain-containing kinase-binding protein 1 isoform X1 [Danaus plexippus]